MRSLIVLVPAVALGLAGCDRGTAPAPVPPARVAATFPAGLFLEAAPADAKPLEEVKASAKPGDTVTLRGRIGGDLSPFVDGRAVLTVVGPGLPACADDPEDACDTPWDYCCESAGDIATHSATVRVTDADGAPLKAGFKGLHGIKELSDLIVVGTVAQAEGGALVVNATGIYVAN